MDYADIIYLSNITMLQLQLDEVSVIFLFRK